MVSMRGRLIVAVTAALVAAGLELGAQRGRPTARRVVLPRRRLVPPRSPHSRRASGTSGPSPTPCSRIPIRGTG